MMNVLYSLLFHNFDRTGEDSKQEMRVGKGEHEHENENMSKNNKNERMNVNKPF